MTSRIEAGDRPAVEVIGIGVQKAATSWLFRCLIEHPELRGSTAEVRDKELNFFNHHYDRGYDWYESQFERGPWKNVEFSVLYFYDRNVPDRVARYNPDARLLLCLRNPVDRAISHYRHEIRTGRVPEWRRNFRDALRRNPSYVDQGLYARHLERWLEHFELERVHIVDYDNVSTRPAEVLSGAFRFLGVDDAFAPSLSNSQVNTSHVLGGGVVRGTLGLGAKAVRRALGGGVATKLRSTAAGRRIQAYRYAEVGQREALPVGSEDRQRLAEVFLPDLHRLSVLLGRDFSHWQ